MAAVTVYIPRDAAALTVKLELVNLSLVAPSICASMPMR